MSLVLEVVEKNFILKNAFQGNVMLLSLVEKNICLYNTFLHCGVHGKGLGSKFVLTIELLKCPFGFRHF